MAMWHIMSRVVPLLWILLSAFNIARTLQLMDDETPVRYDDAQLWRIHNVTASMGGQNWQHLPEILEKEYGASIWREGLNDLDVSINKKNLAAAKSFLKHNNLKAEILNANIQNMFDNEARMKSNVTEAQSVGRSLKATSSGMNWNNYQSLATIYAYMREVTTKFPKIASLINIGKTANGNNLWVLRISENPSGYKKIWIDGGIHAREWISPATVTYIISRLLNNWQQQPAYIKQKTWFIMPVVNPDGYAYSHKVDRLWRKNRAINKGSNCVGVDLNRNFDIGWTVAGSSTNPCSEVYRGPSAASELETRAVAKFLKAQKSNLAAYLTYHSYSQVIVYPWAYKAAVVRNSAEVQRVANLACRRIKAKTGRVYQSSVTYKKFGIAGGGSDDWSRSALGAKYVYTIELRDQGQYGFVLPPNQIIATANEGLIAAFTVAQAV